MKEQLCDLILKKSVKDTSSVASCWILWLGDTTAGFTAPMVPAEFPALQLGTHLAL